MGLGDGEECTEGDTQDTNKSKGGRAMAFRIQDREGDAAAVATASPVVIPGSLLRERGWI